jgi:hypothetical protein
MIQQVNMINMAKFGGGSEGNTSQNGSRRLIMRGSKPRKNE